MPAIDPPRLAVCRPRPAERARLMLPFPPRLGPRPLGLHLMGSAMRAAAALGTAPGMFPWPRGWPSSNAGWPTSKAGQAEVLRIRQGLAAANASPEAFQAALWQRLWAQDRALLAGIAAYRRHPHRRTLADPPVIWREGSARLLDYGRLADPPVLFVPSLVNRAQVLDLDEGASLLRWLAGQGFRPLLLDWGWPGEAERHFTLTDHIAGRLERAMDAVPGGVVLAGYCMGGLLALAAAQRRPQRVRALALLATPWDFHAGGPAVQGRGQGEVQRESRGEAQGRGQGKAQGAAQGEAQKRDQGEAQGGAQRRDQGEAQRAAQWEAQRRGQGEGQGAAQVEAQGEARGQAETQARGLAAWLPSFEPLLQAQGALPVDVLQCLFAALDPFAIADKFRAFGRLDQDSSRARRFVVLEDWLNDGVPLAAPVAREALAGWYGRNDPARGAWRVAGLPVTATGYAGPAFVAVPGRDRIVPPASAMPLAAMPGATLHRAAAGHIGMVAGTGAEAALWRPLAGWLRAL